MGAHLNHLILLQLNIKEFKETVDNNGISV